MTPHSFSRFCQVAALIAPLVSALAACETHAEKPLTSEGAVVAKVNEKSITEADVEREIRRQPESMQGRYQTEHGRKELIESMIRFEVMAQEAEARGVFQDPDIVWFTRQQAINKLIQNEVGKATDPELITEQDVAGYYQAHLEEEFSLPPAYRVRHILLPSREVAEEVAALAKKLTANVEKGFIDLVRKHSTDAMTVNNQGDLGFIDQASPLPKELVEEASRLGAPGDIRGPFQTAQGYHLIQLVAKRAKVVRSLAESEDIIRHRIERERRDQALKAMTERLTSQAKIDRY